jgi:hypothetical protein
LWESSDEPSKAFADGAASSLSQKEIQAGIDQYLHLSIPKIPFLHA